jgi:hypothetical protein
VETFILTSNGFHHRTILSFPEMFEVDALFIISFTVHRHAG